MMHVYAAARHCCCHATPCHADASLIAAAAADTPYAAAMSAREVQEALFAYAASLMPRLFLQLLRYDDYAVVAHAATLERRQYVGSALLCYAA